MTRKPIVKVTTLGRFGVQVRGDPLAFGRKTPLRPLALLKFLVAHGGEVADARVADALWPGKGAAALRPLAINLHRLRRLLGSAEVVMHGARRVALDSRLIWCDAADFERSLDQAAACGRDEDRARLTARALALYRGEFLAGEDASWIVVARERLRARYAAACAAQGARYERLSRIESVSDL